MKAAASKKRSRRIGPQSITPVLVTSPPVADHSRGLTSLARTEWLNRVLATASRIAHGFHRYIRSHRHAKRLTVRETVSLGEKRFLAIVSVDGEQFLIGGASTSVALLAHLDKPASFSAVLDEQHQKGQE